jgi:hypothetical protein
VLVDDRRLILRSDLFDTEYYGAQAPSLAESGLDPVGHYLTGGTTEGLDPPPLVDTSFYLEENPDVASRSGSSRTSCRL